jgi:Cytochrome c554 and c-prime
VSRNKLGLLLVVLGIVGIGLVACNSENQKDPGNTNGSKSDENTNSKEEPLLLEEPSPEDLEATGPMVDNSRCHVCHINYSEEKFAIKHARNDVGCETCHGESDAHCGDEDNITPPDIMFAKEKINPSCLHCHNTEGLKEHKVHTKILAGTATKTKYCTDCHGKTHRLEYRTRRWDKNTGKLIEDDKVRMLEQK